MNERQYRWLRENRHRSGPLHLGEVRPGAEGRPPPLAAVVAQAAKKLRKRQVGAAAWQRVARPVWLNETVVDGVDGDVLVIGVSGSALCYELRRQKVNLERQVARLAPGVHSLRFVVATAKAAPPAGAPQ